MLVELIAALATGAAPCAAAVPQGREVPAPLVFRTSCGGYRLAPSGRVTKLQRGWFAAHGGGTGRRFGADVRIRRTRPGRYLLYRRDRLIWRSSGLYPNDGGSVAFGPHSFAFASYRRGSFRTDLESPERLVVPGRGAYPIDFTRNGRLLIARQATITVVSPVGITERRYRFRPSTGFAFDAADDTIFFVTPDGRLACAAGAKLRLGPNVGGISGSVSLAGRSLVFAAGDRLTVIRRDGAVVASTGWRPGLSPDAGVSASSDGREFAFRLSNVRPGAHSGRATIYLLRAGRREARAIYRHRLGPTGCAYGANLRWHGNDLLYDSVDGEIDLFDRQGGARSLRSFARRLPHRLHGERSYVGWESDYS